MDYYNLSKFIAGIYRGSKNECNKQLDCLKMRATETDLLLFIDEHPNYRQQEIAQKMVMDPSLLARDLRTLAQKNYIKRQCDVDDRRAKRINLTKRGQNQVCQLRQVINDWWQQLFAQHDLDATTVYQTLEAVYDAMTTDKNDSTCC